MKETGDFGLLTKKERLNIEKEVIKLEKNLGGIKEMRRVPGALFIVDPNSERTAILEANKLGIPVIAITDTNCDPTGVDYVVPGNDDAMKSVSMFTEYFANSVSEGTIIAKKNNKLQKDKDSSRDVALEKEIISKYEKDIDLKDEE
jgi:small subunit ribosomal protein S2